MIKNHFFVILCFCSVFQFVIAYRYVVTTYTGDRFGAGTDARVFIKLFGSKGDTREKELEATGRDNFERGQLDTFLLDATNIGAIKRAKIRHDNSWLGPGWFLEKVTVTDENGDYYDFPVHKWLDKHQDDGKTSRDLTPKVKQEKKQKKDEIETSQEPRQPLDCSWPQGLGNGKISDAEISASTSFNDLHLPYHSRLGTIAPNSLGGWCPYKDDKDQYLQFDLGKVKKISGVATQGLGLVDEWTTSYRMLYSNKSEEDFKEYSINGNFPKHLLGNDDQNGTVLHWLKQPFYSRYVRLSPFKWHGKGCLRAELYGCPTKNQNLEDYIQVPERQHENSDEEKINQFAPPEEHREKEHDTVFQGSDTGELLHENQNEEDTGDKHGKIPTKRITKPYSQRNSQPTEEQGTKLLKTEKSFDPISEIDIIPIVHLDFDEIKDKTIPDVSGHHNDAHMRLPIDIRTFSKSCERGVRMNGGDIYFDGEFLIDKPRTEVTISVWIKLFSNGGRHSIFDTIGGKNNKDGQYHFEVDRGRLRWFHRNEARESIFNVTSPLMIPSHTWTHCAATYSSLSGKAAVYINAKLGASGIGTGALSQDWTGRAGIGQHKGGRVLNGELDEFYIFSKALSIRKIQILMKRCSFETDCQRALGMQSKEIADAQISASSTYNLHKSFYGRVNLASFGGDPARTAWCAVKDDRSPYFEIQLPEMTSLTGVATQGLSLFDNWVTSYLFCYSDTKDFWNCYKEKGYDKVFEANTDKNSIKRHHFHHTVDAKYVRIRPQSWYGNHLCMRVEIYGCTMDLIPDTFDSFGSLPVFMEDTEAQLRTEISPKESCNKPLGVSNGEVDDIHLTASSSLDENDQPFNGRLVRESIEQSDIKGCWCAHDVNLRQYLEADLGEIKTITGIATQGYVSHDNWVVSYRLGYSDDANALEWYRENDDERLFNGNTDRSGIVKHFLKRPIQARYVRLNPRAWHGIHVCMRFEIFGCKEAPQLTAARVVVEDEEKEFSQIPTHHTVAELTHHASEAVVESLPRKSILAEENAEDKHYIPKKEATPSSYHLLAEKLDSQVRSHSHKKTHEVQRLKPGHGTAREMLQITYPQPQIISPPHPVNLTIPFNVDSKPPHEAKSLKLGHDKKPIIHALTKDKKHSSKITTTKQNEAEMLKIVDKLQDLSDDKLAAEMKGPILALAKEKILEDLTGIKTSNKVPDNEKCRRGGNCLKHAPPAATLAVTASIPPSVQQLLAQNNQFYAAQQQLKQQQLQQSLIENQQYQQEQNYITGDPVLSPNQLVAKQFQQSGGLTDINNQIPANGMFDFNPYFNQQQQQQQQSPMPASFIDAAKILEKYPDLRLNGITEDVLNSLAVRVPNLGERIEKHFTTRDRALSERNALFEKNQKIEDAKNAKYSTPKFMKDFKTYLQGFSSTDLSKDIKTPSNEGSTNTQQLPNPGQSSFIKPPGIDEHPCRRDGTCVFPEPLFHKPAHAMAPKPDVWIKDAFLLPNGVKDDTRLTPDHLILQGPDPRYLDYYQTYLEGHPGVYLPPTTPIPTTPLPPPPPPPPPPPYVELSTTVEGIPAGSTVDLETHVSNNFDWTPFSVCSVTCGRGEKKRFRRCSQQDCPAGGVEIETIVCIQQDCPDIDPYNWSAFTACSTTCGPGLSSRYRLCKQDNCAVDGYETEQIPCTQSACPVCVLDFEVTENYIVIDQSGWGNHGYMDKHVAIREHPQICGHYADLTNMGEVLFSAQTFLGKPRTGISIACWVNVQGDVAGKHSIFSTIRKTMDNGFIGGYHLELNDGAVRWFHRDEQGKTIYSMMSGVVTIPRVWMHYTAIYDAYKGLARIYVDGKEQGSNVGSGILSEDWGYKASIGFYDFDDRRINGWIDEFIMYDYPLTEDEVFHLLGKMRCPTGKTTTIEIDAFKFENVNMNIKRSIKDGDENINSTEKISKDNFTSKINTKYKRGLNETNFLKTNNSTASVTQTKGMHDIRSKRHLGNKHLKRQHNVKPHR